MNYHRKGGNIGTNLLVHTLPFCQFYIVAVVVLPVGSSEYNWQNHTSNCTNDDCIPDEDYIELMVNDIYPDLYDWLLIAMHSIVFIIGLIGNALVCLAVYRNHSMRTVTNYFIVNLAVADFLVIILCLPSTVLWDVTETWFLGLELCKAIPYFQTVSVSVSILTLTFISIDRWYAICFPLSFKSTTGRAKTAIILIWLMAFLFDIPELVVLHTVPPKTRVETVIYTQCGNSWSLESETTFTVIKFIFLYTAPLAFMSFAYWQIACVLWRSDIPGHGFSGGLRCRSEMPSSGGSHPESQLRSRRKAAKMLVAVVIVFAVCYFPVYLLLILRNTITLPSSQATTASSLLAHWLIYANSAMNPLIYNFMSGKFRKEFKRAFRCSPRRSYIRGTYKIASDVQAGTQTHVIAKTIPTMTNNVRQTTEVIPLNAIIHQTEKQE